MSTRAPRSTRARKKRPKILALTACYTPCPEGGYMGEILEARGVLTQGETLDETRANLLDATSVMFEEAPKQFSQQPRLPEAPAILERFYVVIAG